MKKEGEDGNDSGKEWNSSNGTSHLSSLLAQNGNGQSSVRVNSINFTWIHSADG